MRIRSASFLALASCFWGSAFGCSGSPAAPAEVASQTLSVKMNPVLLGVGETGMASATLTSSSNTNSVPAGIMWQSTDPLIATVDAQGNVAGIARGQVSIRSQVQELSASKTLRILSGDELSMTFAVGAGGGVKPDGSIIWNMSIGQVMTLTPRAVYDKTSISSTIYDVSPGSRATWTSSNPLSVSVTSTGQVTGHTAGVADVTASWLGKVASVQITVF